MKLVEQSTLINKQKKKESVQGRKIYPEIKGKLLDNGTTWVPPITYLRIAHPVAQLELKLPEVYDRR